MEDAKWGGSPIDMRSTTRYCAFLGGNLITWRSKKQAKISLSSAEAEYRALVKGISEVIWIRNILGELAFEQCRPTTVLCDSKAAIGIAHNLVLHDMRKHIELNKHWIREKIDEKHVHVQHTRSVGQLADALTKGLARPMFETSCQQVGNSKPQLTNLRGGVLSDGSCQGPFPLLTPSLISPLMYNPIKGW